MKRGFCLNLYSGGEFTMNNSAETQLMEKIKELEVQLACTPLEDTQKLIELQLECYRDSLIMVRRQSIGEVQISPHPLGWEAIINSAIFLIRKHATATESGYECYIQHQYDSDYYKLISTELFNELSDASKFILAKYKEGIV